LSKTKGILQISVIVASLGYFVDLYDLVLFGVVKDPSLKALGFSDPHDLFEKGKMLLQMQMFGMLVGGIIWGILGDKKGRLSVLFGTIFLYSAANIANGFVHDITTYAALRFIAGVGLAGELGAGITLIAETLPKEKRGYGTMIVVAFGALGAVLAGMVGSAFEWRIAYYVGGGLGILLLLMRIGTYESGMFESIRHEDIKKGAFLHLFSNWNRFSKYIACIMVGLPVWYTIGILIFFAPEFGKLMHVNGEVVTGKAVLWSYIGLSVGDTMAGLISQKLKSRKKTIILYLVTSLLSFMWYWFVRDISTGYFYFLTFILGAATGYWAIFVTIAAEQFGTNLRSTVTNTVPNFVRGAVVPITAAFAALKDWGGTLESAIIVGLATLALALVSIVSLKESFHKDLNYIEEIS
jgi:MFS family permease